MSEIIVAEQGNADEALDMEKAKEVADTLFRTYPGYLWAVGVQGRILAVQILGMMGLTQKFEGAGNNPWHWDRYKFAIKHLDAYSASDLAKKAVMAGGEILERAGLPRRGLSQ